ncbi:hypothetical protein BO86DRAFT_98938 [Aspergillus japonicus CBS 114.51]|uniref:Uncharacterized protein n=1 Tax=Aspergillus japonicus CBS 114.51 TaxID=1448312 RepID=A0A8T8X078_ASPJA|nr:hypothetical protein BO86DRAFT_98938 [Aspergillus japonicus CBS 114.51]RAH81537.1 hypothetical protein BO86DRAFT_98938 [Aspergillus japonicus CBS 114.51]
MESSAGENWRGWGRPLWHCGTVPDRMIEGRMRLLSRSAKPASIAFHSWEASDPGRDESVTDDQHGWKYDRLSCLTSHSCHRGRIHTGARRGRLGDRVIPTCPDQECGGCNLALIDTHSRRGQTAAKALITIVASGEELWKLFWHDRRPLGM